MLSNEIDLRVLLDPFPTSDLGLQRLDTLKSLGVTFVEELTYEKIVFVGGSLAKLNENLILKDVQLDLVVMNGGFIGSNIMNPKYELKKFKNKDFVRTYNFNLNVESTVSFLNNNNIKEIYLIGKNVCHNKLNTLNGIWKNNEVVKSHGIKESKLLHDVLMVSEGLNLLNNKDTMLNYVNIKVVNKGLEGKYTEWGSLLENESRIKGAVSFK